MVHSNPEKPLTRVYVEVAPNGGYIVYDYVDSRLGDYPQVKAAFSSLDDALMWVKRAFMRT